MSKFIFAAAVLGALAQPHNNIFHAPDNGGAGAGDLGADFKNQLLTGLKDIKGTQDALGKSLADLQAKHQAFEGESKTLAEQVLEIRKIQLAAKSVMSRSNKRHNEVSDDCARHLGAIAIQAAFMQGFVPNEKSDKLGGLYKDITGVEIRAALTSSDIPLPIGYSGDVAELVGMFGSARQYGTVFPLANGSFKLPKLGTDTTFGLIAGSGTVTEKSPTVTNVTFNAEKFGGLVRLPTELDEDSIVSIGQFVARYAARQIARAEDHNFWVGTGAASGVNGTAEGLTKSVVTDSKTTVSGVLGSPSEFTLTHFRTLRGICDASALRNGAYYMHPSFEQLLNTYNTSGNRPYNPQAQIMGSGAQPFVTGPTLDGFPIRWVDVMPVYSTSDVVSTVHALFGDASFNYLGVRGGIRFDTSKEAGFTTDEILIRALERFTIGKMATGCVGGLITHSS
jgi:HK97 family phage major capsid protein